MFDGFAWDIAVPDGDYTVHIVAGDANKGKGREAVNVEGITLLDATATKDQKWVEATGQVTVADGQLTLTNAGAKVAAKLAYIEITQALPTTPPPPVSQPTPPPPPGVGPAITWQSGEPSSPLCASKSA